jgi:hypothetical protein
VSKVFGIDFKDDVEINKLHLDGECEVQAAMYYHYSSQLSDARAEQDRAKMQMEYTLGKREIAIRSNPPDGIKVTEAVISALVASDTEVNTVKEAYAVATKTVSALYSAVNALEQRKSMLDNLVKLQVSSYYQGTSDTGDDIRAGLNRRG